MCGLCTEAGRFELCADCRERTGAGDFPLRRDALTLGELLRHSWTMYMQNVGAITLGLLLMFALSVVAGMISTLLALPFGDDPSIVLAINGVMFVPQLLLQGIVTLGLCAMSLSAAKGEMPTMDQLFGHYRRAFSWLLQLLALYLIMIPVAVVVAVPFFIFARAGELSTLGFVGFLLAAPLYVYLMLGLVFGPMQLVDDAQVGALSALAASWRLAAGKRALIFAAGVVVIVALGVGLLACGVGMVFSAGFGAVTLASLYLGLKNGHA